MEFMNYKDWENVELSILIFAGAGRNLPSQSEMSRSPRCLEKAEIA
jgi:hypothetical protein